MVESRVKKSIRNLVSGLIYRILMIATSFVVRTIFISTLNSNYLGLNGFYISVLSILSLAELGFGTAMIYSMYKPLAISDYEKVSQQLCLFKKVYRIIGLIIFLIGISLIPLLNYLIRDASNVNGFKFYYFLFLLNTVVSYLFFAHKVSILQADQKGYIVSNYSAFINLVKSICQVIVLLYFKNYTLYLIIQISSTLWQNSLISNRVNKDYPNINDSNSKLSKKESIEIFKNVKALMLQKISFTVLNSSEAIVISAFVGIKWVGLLSNYAIIMEAVTGVLCQVTSAISASLGNYFSIMDKNLSFNLFKKVEFLNFWIYSISAIMLTVLLNPFIKLWIGDQFVIDFSIVLALTTRFFMAGFMNTMSVVRSSLGLFTQGQYRPILSAILNIIISIVLLKILGIIGVILATTLTRLIVDAWYTAYVIFKFGFFQPVIPFYKTYFIRIHVLIGITFLMLLIRNLVFEYGVNIFTFSIMFVLSFIVPNLLLGIYSLKNPEFMYYISFGISKINNYFVKSE